MPTLDTSHKRARGLQHAPRFNDDGVSVAGCKIIYAPKGQAGEYAPLAANLYRGCGHKCAYCYVPLVTKQDRKEFDEGAVLRDDILEIFARDAAKYRALGSDAQVMFSFTTDPYHPFDNTPTRGALEILRANGMAFCPLTKGGSRALRDIDLFRIDRDAFASTLTSTDAKFSRKWERGAADPDDRIATLREFHKRGIFTWVSLEPTLDINASLSVVEATHGFVDLYKVGRANYLKEITKTTNWRAYTHAMLDRLTALGKAAYIKKDLQPFLPPGFPNPLRIAQNNAAASRADRARLVQLQFGAWRGGRP